MTTVTHIREQQNNRKAVVKGKRINKGSDYGKEVPREYHLTGGKFSILWLNSKLGNEGFEVELILRTFDYGH